MNKLVRFFVLPTRQQVLLVEATLELARASLLLRILPWKVVGKGLMVVKGRTDTTAALEVEKFIQLSARNLPWRPTCLRQALATQRMLRRRRVEGRIHFDFPDPKNAIHGHAWLTSGDVLLLDPPRVERS